MVIIIRNELGGPVCISLFANTLGKGMNPSILSAAMRKIVEQTGFFSMATGLGEVKLWIQTRCLSVGHGSFQWLFLFSTIEATLIDEQQ